MSWREALGFDSCQKCALGSGVARRQKPHAVGNPRRPHADEPLANRGLLFCAGLGSLRQRASVHGGPQPGRRRPENVLWERVKDRAATPSNHRVGITSSKSTGSVAAAAEPRVDPRAGVSWVSFRAGMRSWGGSGAAGLLSGPVLFRGKPAFSAVVSPPWGPWAKGFRRVRLGGGFAPLLVHASQRPPPS